MGSKKISSGSLSKKVVFSAILGNGFLGIFKFFAWMFSLSPSMLAEAIHSIADVSNQILLYIGLKQSDRAPTPEHPWGFGNASYLWNLISAVGIFFLGCGVTFYHGFSSLLNPKPYSSDNIWLNVIVLIVALGVEGYVLLIAIKAVKKLKQGSRLINYIKYGDDPTAIAVLLEDSIAVLGLFVAFLGIFLSYLFRVTWPDAIASLFIGFLLGVLAILLVKVNLRLLLGASIPPAKKEKITNFLESLPQVEKVTSLKTEILGPGRLLLAAEIEFHGESMINRDQIIKDAESVRSGEEDILPVLVDTASRMVRTVGNEINDVERKLIKEFPQLEVISLEVN